MHLGDFLLLNNWFNFPESNLGVEFRLRKGLSFVSPMTSDAGFGRSCLFFEEWPPPMPQSGLYRPCYGTNGQEVSLRIAFLCFLFYIYQEDRPPA